MLGETLSAPSEASAIPLARIVEQGTVHGGSVFSVTKRHFIFFYNKEAYMDGGSSSGYHQCMKTIYTPQACRRNF